MVIAVSIAAAVATAVAAVIAIRSVFAVPVVMHLSRRFYSLLLLPLP